MTRDIVPAVTCLHEWNLIAIPEEPTIQITCRLCQQHLRDHLDTLSDPAAHFSGYVEGIYVDRGHHYETIGRWVPVDVYVRASTILSRTGGGFVPQQEITVRLTSKGPDASIIESTFIEG